MKRLIVALWGVAFTLSMATAPLKMAVVNPIVVGQTASFSKRVDKYITEKHAALREKLEQLEDEIAKQNEKLQEQKTRVPAVSTAETEAELKELRIKASGLVEKHNGMLEHVLKLSNDMYLKAYQEALKKIRETKKIDFVYNADSLASYNPDSLPDITAEVAGYLNKQLNQEDFEKLKKEIDEKI